MENELLQVVDALPGLVWTALPNGHVDFLNRRWCEYTGMSAKDALQCWQKAIHPGDLPELLGRWRAILTSGEPQEMDARLRRFDGEYRWFLIRTRPILDASGQVVKWCGLNTEIEDRRRMEALLTGETELLEMVAGGRPMQVILEWICRLVESVTVGCYCSIAVMQPGGTRLEHGAAPSFPREFIESIIDDPINGDPYVTAALSNKQVIVSNVLSDSRWARCSWRQMALHHGIHVCWSTPVVSAGGKVMGVCTIYFDNHRTPTPFDRGLIGQIARIASIAVERTQHDATLKRSEAFLAETRRLSSTGGFSKRVSTGEITWSEEVYRMFEFDAAKPVTLELIRSRVHPEDRVSFEDMLDRQQRGIDYEHEYRLLMPNQSVKYMHVVAHATRDASGQVEYIAAIQDVTERRRSEAALIEARSELTRVARASSFGVLTASIAHEVNQPLSGIITNASTCLRMLGADPPNLDGARETARRTIRDGNRASDVINRLRALFGKTDATMENVDLNESISEIITLFRSELHRSRVTLQIDLANGLPHVAGDRVQLQQVILNLILNALEAMSSIDDRPRHLLVKTEHDADDSVRVSVADTGVGFGLHELKRLFDAFYTTKPGGMGIGLSVSKSIIDNHDGRLWATANESGGATFSFSIPKYPKQRKGGNGRSARWTAGVTDMPQFK
ncbi:PAS domain-containing protein [Paraburkholderia hospita]|uniref:PAS domain-containing protein n=1 Tax=Paraburkholderia hospita TaxID=169430 RepID=UPI0009A75EB9|nr:PAS domain-containing protein [Paraburkholderia hospita]SKD05497.1 PAS domain S-box-containing protein [Paraburkholderia hospita]